MTSGRVLILPQSLYMELQKLASSTGFANLVSAADGGEYLELTEAGAVSPAQAAMELRNIAKLLRGTSIHGKEPLVYECGARPPVQKPNFAAMRAKLLGKKGRWQ